MTDIITSWDSAAGAGDWYFAPDNPAIWVDENGDPIVDEHGGLINAILAPGLPTSSDLATAVLISLFSDEVASDDDALPDPSGDKRGWWGGPIGSKLWLRHRSKPTTTLLAQIKSDIQTALAWLVADGVAGSIDVTVEYTRPGMLGTKIVIHRASGTDLALRFANLWDAA
jgi:phage gp46-like protein